VSCILNISFVHSRRYGEFLGIHCCTKVQSFDYVHLQSKLSLFCYFGTFHETAVYTAECSTNLLSFLKVAGLLDYRVMCVCLNLSPCK
jgi:hypothetical protein